VGEGVLLWDRGLHSFEMVRGTLARGCELLGRLPRTVKPGAPVAILSDGTQLVWVRPSDYGGRKKRGERVLVRLIRYTLEDPNRPGHRIGDLANKSWVSVTLGAAYPSRGSQNSAAQQPEARPTVHRALYELELVDEALHGSVAPPLRQPCTHRRKVFLEPLGEATLKGTDLGDADLAGARLEGADLSGANLCGTSLTRAYLTGAKLAGASYDRRTAWPEGFEPQESGAERLEP